MAVLNHQFFNVEIGTGSELVAISRWVELNGRLVKKDSEEVQRHEAEHGALPLTTAEEAMDILLNRELGKSAELALVNHSDDHCEGDNDNDDDVWMGFED
jgi:hypothetical protein